MTLPSLILFRHGNTFEADQKPVMVGALTDMPLTKRGEEQAEKAASYTERYFKPVSTILAGPLQRTQRFAEKIAEHLHRKFRVDNRLCEIDYGLWEGLSGEQIVDRYGKDIKDQWEEKGEWPESMGWLPSHEELQQTLRSFLDEQFEELHRTQAHRVAVTSNGILRVLHHIVTGHASGSIAKVKTGHACVLTPNNLGWKIVKWNDDPFNALAPQSLSAPDASR